MGPADDASESLDPPASYACSVLTPRGSHTGPLGTGPLSPYDLARLQRGADREIMLQSICTGLPWIS